MNNPFEWTIQSEECLTLAKQKASEIGDKTIGGLHIVAGLMHETSRDMEGSVVLREELSKRDPELQKSTDVLAHRVDAVLSRLLGPIYKGDAKKEPKLRANLLKRLERILGVQRATHADTIHLLQAIVDEKDVWPFLEIFGTSRRDMMQAIAEARKVK